MPNLQIREVSAAVYGALAEASQKEHRSLSQQTLVTIEKGLGFSGDPKERRQRVIQSIRKTDVRHAARLPDPVALVREDRSR